MVLDMVIATLAVPNWFFVVTYVLYGLAYIGIAVINIIPHLLL